MSAATTILFAREDLSIPGGAEVGISGRDRPDSIQAHFFELISRSSPDVIVLDFSRAAGAGTNTILTVRRRTDIPILVVCSPEQPQIENYRIAGAADCIAAPVDIVSLNQTIQRIVRVRGRGRPVASRAPDNFRFAGVSFLSRPQSAYGAGRQQHRPDNFGGPSADAFRVAALDALHAQRNRRTALWTRALGRRPCHRCRGQSASQKAGFGRRD